MDGFMNNMFYNPYAGLLGPEEDARLQQAARSQGLLNIAANLLAAGGPSTTPQGLGQALARGVIGGQQAAQDVYMQGMQAQLMKTRMEDEKRKREAQKTFEERIGAATKMVPSIGVTPGGQQANMLTEQMQGFAPEDMLGTQQALMSAGATRQVTDQVAADRAVMDYLRVASPVEYAKIVASSAKEGGYEKVDLGNSIAFVDKRDPTRIVSTIQKTQDAKDTNQTEMKIYDDFSKAATPYVGISQAYKKIESSTKEPSAAGDLSLIFNYMKILDPGSVVREGEFATAQNAAGIPDVVRNLYNRVMSGTRLGPEQRQDFLNQAKNLVASQKELFADSVLPRFDTQIKNYKLNRENIIFDPFAGIDLSKPVKPSSGGGQTKKERRPLGEIFK